MLGHIFSNGGTFMHIIAGLRKGATDEPGLAIVWTFSILVGLLSFARIWQGDGAWDIVLMDVGLVISMAAIFFAGCWMAFGEVADGIGAALGLIITSASYIFVGLAAGIVTRVLWRTFEILFS